MQGGMRVTEQRAGRGGAEESAPRTKQGRKRGKRTRGRGKAGRSGAGGYI